MTDIIRFRDLTKAEKIMLLVAYENGSIPAILRPAQRWALFNDGGLINTRNMIGRLKRKGLIVTDSDYFREIDLKLTGLGKKTVRHNLKLLREL